MMEGIPLPAVYKPTTGPILNLVEWLTYGRPQRRTYTPGQEQPPPQSSDTDLNADGWERVGLHEVAGIAIQGHLRR